jgi:hypothetical protein
MRTFEIIIQGNTYFITELNKITGLYEVCCDGVLHTVGKSSKTGEWLYIRKSAFSPFLPVKSLTSALEIMIADETLQKLIA